MKWTIFLLALCAFKTVFADEFENELFGVHERTIIHMEGIVAFFHAFARAEVVKGQERNVQSNQCMEEYRELQRYLEAKITQCNECYTSSLGHRNLQFAQLCYFHSITALVKEANSRRRNVYECIENILAGHPYLLRPAADTEAKPSISNP